MKEKQNKKCGHEPCYCDSCEAERYNQSCGGCGFHSSFWKSTIESDYWKKWKKYAWEDKMLYDFPECEELGIISAKHFQDFIKFTIKNKKG